MTVFNACKWTFLTLLSSGSVIMPFGIIIIDNISYELRRQHDNRYDMTSETWSYDENKFIFETQEEYQNTNLMLEYYDCDEEKCLVWNNTLISFDETQILDEIVNDMVLNNVAINAYITDTYLENTASSPHANEYTITTTANFSLIKNDETFSITVTANNGGVVLLENTDTYTNSYSFNAKILLMNHQQFDLSLLNDMLFADTCLNFLARTTNNIKLFELNSYGTYEYTEVNQIELLKSNIVTYIFNASKINVSVDEFDIRIDTAQISNYNFSFRHIVPLIITANDNSMYLTRSGVIGTYMQAIYALPSLRSLNAHDYGEDSFNVLNPATLTETEFANITDNDNLKNAILNEIKSDIAPDATADDFTVTLIGTETFLANRDYSQWVDLEYQVTANDTQEHIQDQAIVKYRIVALKTITSVQTEFTADLNWSKTLWHEGEKILGIWFPSYGNWQISISGIALKFNYNEAALENLTLNQSYTITQAQTLGLFANGGQLPTMNTANGSFIKLSSNDYTDTDFSGLSWLGLVEGGVFTLDSCRAKPFNENWDTNSDWIMPGSRNHDFYLRLTNFWENIRLIKKIDVNGIPYMESAFVGDINWSFALNSRWRADANLTYTNRDEAMGSFTPSFFENVVEHNDPWTSIQ